ncbi:MAG: TolC family protein [Planctomycetales bacterium]|nr:TolC family protein [Planctomycetales bacterium]
MAAKLPTTFLACLFVSLVGCRAGQRAPDRDYQHVAHAVHQARRTPAPDVTAVSPVVSGLAGQHPVDDYIAYALGQNPDIQAARKRMEAVALQVPVASSLDDPMVGMTFFPEPIQTAAGQQEFSLSAQQKFPWRNKLAARAELVESQTNVARAQLAAAELATIRDVKRAYYEIYYLQQAIAVTRTDQRLLGEIRDVANARYKAAQTSQQDLLRAELAIANVENDLITLNQQLASAQARLARVLHVSPQTQVRALDRLNPEQVPHDLDWLQRQAVAARPELHAQLAALDRDQEAVELARLNYLPDVTLGASWVDVSSAGISPVANGRDAFLITAGVNLPIYRKRLSSSVRSAEAAAVSTARMYDSMRDQTLEEVMDLFVRARSQHDLIVLFREDILPKARQTLDVSTRAYSTGEVDFLTLIDNWQQLLRYEINYQRLEASLRQTTAELERVVGGFSSASTETLPTLTEPPQPLPPLN